jgi:hypothetical protein
MRAKPKAPPDSLNGDGAREELDVCSEDSDAGGGTRTPDTRIMIPLL